MEDHERRSYDLEIASLKREVTDLKEEITELRQDIKGLINAWNTAQGVTTFVKWLTGVIISVGIIVTFVRQTGGH